MVQLTHQILMFYCSDKFFGIFNDSLVKCFFWQTVGTEPCSLYSGVFWQAYRAHQSRAYNRGCSDKPIGSTFSQLHRVISWFTYEDDKAKSSICSWCKEFSDKCPRSVRDHTMTRYWVCSPPRTMHCCGRQSLERIVPRHRGQCLASNKLNTCPLCQTAASCSATRSVYVHPNNHANLLFVQ